MVRMPIIHLLFSVGTRAPLTPNGRWQLGMPWPLLSTSGDSLFSAIWGTVAPIGINWHPPDSLF